MVVWKVFKSMFLWIENMYSRSIQGAWSWGRQGEQLPLPPPHTLFSWDYRYSKRKCGFKKFEMRTLEPQATDL